MTLELTDSAVQRMHGEPWGPPVSVSPVLGLQEYSADIALLFCSGAKGQTLKSMFANMSYSSSF